MSTLTLSLARELEARVFGLAVACPCDQGNPIDCPLYEIRKMSLRQRHVWAHSQSEEDMRALLEHHEKCSAMKLIHSHDAAQQTSSVDLVAEI